MQHLYVLQRTPGWIIPRGQYRYWGWVKRLFAAVPFVQRLYRWYLYWVHDVRFFAAFKPTWPLYYYAQNLATYASAIAYPVP
jgi:hypothetical protein